MIMFSKTESYKWQDLANQLRKQSGKIHLK
jgi:hypothetical protein